MRRTALVGLVLVAGCGGSDSGSGNPPDPQRESLERPAAPPAGWRVVGNREAGLSVSAPRTWPARIRGPATLIRSEDRLLAVSLTADRSEGGRGLSAQSYARRTLLALPGFRRARPVRLGQVARSPYGSFEVQAKADRRRVRVAAFQKPRRVTYTAVAFSNAGVAPQANDATLQRILASLRGRAPAL